MVFYYTTQISNNKIYYNLYTKKKNDSDVNIKFNLGKKYKISTKFFRTKFLSKNILLLNVEKSILNSSDIYIILTCLIRSDKNFGNVSILKFYREKNKHSNSCLFSNRINFIPNSLHRKKIDNLIFGLIECYNTKISKKIVRTVNKLELIELNFLFELRFIRNINKINSIIIEHTKKIPTNYFPKFITKKNNCQKNLAENKKIANRPSFISLHSNNILEFYSKQHNSIRYCTSFRKKIIKRVYVLNNFHLNSILCIFKSKKNPDDNCY
nr:hypothetical protein CparaKRNrm1_p074 [Cryptomonas paramecium]